MEKPVDEELTIELPAAGAGQAWAIKIPTFLYEKWAMVRQEGVHLGTILVDGSYVLLLGQYLPRRESLVSESVTPRDLSGWAGCPMSKMARAVGAGPGGLDACLSGCIRDERDSKRLRGDIRMAAPGSSPSIGARTLR
jgi:hypothetical protein